MITEDNPSMSSTAESIYIYNSDENIRELCRRREDAIAHENYQKKLIRDLSDENDLLKIEKQDLTDKNKSLSNEIAFLRGLLAANHIKIE